MGGGGLGDMGDMGDMGDALGDEGDLGGEEDLGGEGDLGDETEAGEESSLLAAPAKRNELRKYEKSEYTTVPYKKSKKTGPYRRHIKSKAGTSKENRGASSRSTFPGMMDLQNLKSLSYGVTENKQPIYNNEENEILRNSAEIKNLITILESKYEKK